jgi:hypothetical protein
MGNPSLKGNAFTLGHNVTPMEDNNTLLERKRKKMVVEFDANYAHDGLVGCKDVTLNFFNYMVKLFCMLQLITIISSRPHSSI